MCPLRQRIHIILGHGGGGGVFPLDGPCVGGVGVDVAAELASYNRSETEVKIPRAMTSRSILANQISTWLSQDEYVGVK